MKNRQQGKIKNFSSCVLVFYCAMLILQSAAPCFADEKWLEGKIAGTGPGKVWILIGSNQGVTEGMIFEVRHDDAVIGKIKVKKVGASSSEAEIIEIAKEDIKISPGDMARWMLPPEFEEKKEETTPATTTTTPVATTPATETPTKEEPKTETVPTTEIKKEIVPSTTVTKTETKKEEQKKTVKKKGKGFGKKMWLYIAIAGAAAFALAGKGKSSGSATNPTGESISSSSDNAPTLPF